MSNNSPKPRDTQISFEDDVKPLFTEGDRDCMLGAFDLWSASSVQANATSIYAALSSKKMPPQSDRKWDDTKLAAFKAWVDAGFPSKDPNDPGLDLPLPPIITTTLGFETDIKPMFRPQDRNSIPNVDLWDWWSVRDNADTIFPIISTGKWPADRPLDQKSINNFQEWQNGGKPEIPTIVKQEFGKDQLVIKMIKDEDARLRGVNPWLNKQDAIGMGIFLTANFLICLFSYLYYKGSLGVYTTIISIAFFISFLHELEHDLVHDLYFSDKKWVQDIMNYDIWFVKVGVSPWVRRFAHLKHHRESGQITDLEERFIGLGLPPSLLWVRIGIGINPVFASFIVNHFTKDNPKYGPALWTMSMKSLPTMILLEGWWILFFLIPFLPANVVWWVKFIAVVNVWPNVIQKVALQLLSTYSHYYEDIPQNNVFFQNQILNHWTLYPLQIFACNFGATHILHHYVPEQPFYLRNWVYYGVVEPMKALGVRENDFGTFWRSNHYQTSWSKQKTN